MCHKIFRNAEHGDTVACRHQGPCEVLGCVERWGRQGEDRSESDPGFTGRPLRSQCQCTTTTISSASASSIEQLSMLCSLRNGRMLQAQRQNNAIYAYSLEVTWYDFFVLLGRISSRHKCFFWLWYLTPLLWNVFWIHSCRAADGYFKVLRVTWTMAHLDFSPLFLTE